MFSRSQRERYTFKVHSKLATSLCEDVFHFVQVQLSALKEHTSKSSNLLAEVTTIFFDELVSKQLSIRESFLYDLESTCASANDYFRMSENAEDLMVDMKQQCKSHKDVERRMDQSLSELLDLYGKDAVYTAQYASKFVIASIEEAIEEDLFSLRWEKDLVNNQLAGIMVKTMEDFLEDFEKWLDPFLYRKAVEALVMASCVFYVETLVSKSGLHDDNKVPYFNDPVLAVERMKGDILVLHSFFESLTPNCPTLSKVIDQEFSLLDTIMLCASAAISSDSKAAFENNAENMISAYQRVGDLELTRNLIGDICHLLTPSIETKVRKLMKHMKWNEEFQEKQDIVDESYRNGHEGLIVQIMLRQFYSNNRRKIPTTPMKKIKLVVKEKFKRKARCVQINQK